MFENAKILATAMWKWFCSRSLFVQLLLVVPILSAILLTIVVGNMGLALMGTAIAINSLFAGWISGFVAIVVGKAGFIIAKDYERKD